MSDDFDKDNNSVCPDPITILNSGYFLYLSEMKKRAPEEAPVFIKMMFFFINILPIDVKRWDLLPPYHQSRALTKSAIYINAVARR